MLIRSWEYSRVRRAYRDRDTAKFTIALDIQSDRPKYIETETSAFHGKI
jgi:hypothetical protein